MKSNRYSIVLGGIGGDSHSVGLLLLRHALCAMGLQVQYLGIQNCLEDFFIYAPHVNAVMISTLDGHARHYLQGFPAALRERTLRGTRWYIGGNLDIHADTEATVRYFTEMGFHLVVPKFKSIVELEELVMKDLRGCGVRPRELHVITWPSPHVVSVETGFGKLSDAEFTRERRNVLEQWPTGHGAESFEDNAGFLGGRPRFSEVLSQVRRSEQMLLQPRCGVALSVEQITIFRKLEAAGVRVASYQVDSLTRNNRYLDVEEEIRRSVESRRSTLNGYPVINHGVSVLRATCTSVGIPLQVRHSTRDPRLLAEISFAGGVTSFEGGAICYNVPYYKDYPLSESIERWRYVDRLTALYGERYGVVLNREFFGTLTATLIPPSLAICVNVLEALLAAEQGVRDMSLGYAEQGNRSQDIAAIRSIVPLTRKYLEAFGFKQVSLSTVMHQFMSAFPTDPGKASQLIFQSGITAYLSGATRLMTKSPVEAIRIPTIDENLKGVGLVRRSALAARSIATDEERVAEEIKMIEIEVGAIIDSVLALGSGSIVRGIVKAFERGILDIPFSPSIFNAGEVLTARDHEGAVRFLRFGGLPFDRRLREWHLERMAVRRRHVQGPHQDFVLVESDIRAIIEGRYECWPLDSGLQQMRKKIAA